MSLAVRARSGLEVIKFSIIWIEIVLKFWGTISEHLECEVTDGCTLGNSNI